MSTATTNANLVHIFSMRVCVSAVPISFIKQTLGPADAPRLSGFISPFLPPMYHGAGPFFARCFIGGRRLTEISLLEKGISDKPRWEVNQGRTMQSKDRSGAFVSCRLRSWLYLNQS